MISLTSDKLTLIRAGFSIKDPVHQGPRRSTPKQITHPEGLASLEKAVQGYISQYSVTGRDDAYQKVVYPLLSATVRRPMQVAA
jgi:hypothetical protein